MLATQCLGLVGYILIDFGLHSFGRFVSLLTVAWLTLVCIRSAHDEDTTTFSYPPLSAALASIDNQSPSVLRIFKGTTLSVIIGVIRNIVVQR